MVAAASAARGRDRDCACAAWSRSRRGLRRGLERFAEIGLHHQRDIAGDLATAAGEIAITEAASAMRSRWVCQGASGSGNLSSYRDASPTRSRFRRVRRAWPPRRRIAAPGLWRNRCNRASRAIQRRGILRELQSEASAAHAAARCAPPPPCGDARACAASPRRRGRDRPGARRSPREGSASPPYRSRPGWLRPNAQSAASASNLATRSGERLDEGDGEIPGPVAPSADAADIERFRLAGLRDRLGGGLRELCRLRLRRAPGRLEMNLSCRHAHRRRSRASRRSTASARAREKGRSHAARSLTISHTPANPKARRQYAPLRICIPS